MMCSGVVYRVTWSGEVGLCGEVRWGGVVW